MNRWDYLGMEVYSIEGTLNGGVAGFGAEVGGGVFLETANAKSVFDIRIGLSGFINRGIRAEVLGGGSNIDFSWSPGADYAIEISGTGFEVSAGAYVASYGITNLDNGQPLVHTFSVGPTFSPEDLVVPVNFDAGLTTSYYSDSISLRELYNLALPKAVFNNFSDTTGERHLTIVEKYLGTANEYEDWMFDKNYSKKYDIIYETGITLEPFVVYGHFDESQDSSWIVNFSYAESRHIPFRTSTEKWNSFGFGDRISSHMRSILDPVGHAESQMVKAGHMTSFEAQARAFSRQVSAKFNSENSR